MPGLLRFARNDEGYLNSHVSLFLILYSLFSGILGNSGILIFFALINCAILDIICLVVLDGDVAAPCNPQSAVAGLNSHLRRVCVGAVPFEKC